MGIDHPHPRQRMMCPGGHVIRRAQAQQRIKLIGRQGGITRDFVLLRQELVEALRRLKALAVATP